MSRPARKDDQRKRLAVNDDDRRIGRILSRREVLSALGGTALIAACAPATLSATATSTTAMGRSSRLERGRAPALRRAARAHRGSYFVDEKLNRFDIRSDRRAAP